MHLRNDNRSAFLLQTGHDGGGLESFCQAAKADSPPQKRTEPVQKSVAHGNESIIGSHIGKN